VGNEQDLHFKSIFACARKCKLIGNSVRTDHVGFGMILGTDGKKFKTRSGDTVILKELLDEAKSRARAKIEERDKSEEGTHLTEEEFESSSEILGMSSVKYYDIKQNRTTS